MLSEAQDATPKDLIITLHFRVLDSARADSFNGFQNIHVFDCLALSPSLTCVAMKLTPILSNPHACTHDFRACQPVGQKKNDVLGIHSCEDPRWSCKLEVNRPVVLQHKILVCESEKVGISFVTTTNITAGAGEVRAAT